MALHIMRKWSVLPILLYCLHGLLVRYVAGTAVEDHPKPFPVPSINADDAQNTDGPVLMRRMINNGGHVFPRPTDGRSTADATTVRSRGREMLCRMRRCFRLRRHGSSSQSSSPYGDRIQVQTPANLQYRPAGFDPQQTRQSDPYLAHTPSSVHHSGFGGDDSISRSSADRSGSGSDGLKSLTKGLADPSKPALLPLLGRTRSAAMQTEPQNKALSIFKQHSDRFAAFKGSGSLRRISENENGQGRAESRKYRLELVPRDSNEQSLSRLKTRLLRGDSDVGLPNPQKSQKFLQRKHNRPLMHEKKRPKSTQDMVDLVLGPSKIASSQAHTGSRMRETSDEDTQSKMSDEKKRSREFDLEMQRQIAEHRNLESSSTHNTRDTHPLFYDPAKHRPAQTSHREADDNAIPQLLGLPDRTSRVRGSLDERNPDKQHERALDRTGSFRTLDGDAKDDDIAYGSTLKSLIHRAKGEGRPDPQLLPESDTSPKDIGDGNKGYNARRDESEPLFLGRSQNHRSRRHSPLSKGLSDSSGHPSGPSDGSFADYASTTTGRSPSILLGHSPDASHIFADGHPQSLSHQGSTLYGSLLPNPGPSPHIAGHADAQATTYDTIDNALYGADTTHGDMRSLLMGQDPHKTKQQWQSDRKQTQVRQSRRQPGRSVSPTTIDDAVSKSGGGSLTGYTNDLNAMMDQLSRSSADSSPSAPFNPYRLTKPRPPVPPSKSAVPPLTDLEGFKRLPSLRTQSSLPINSESRQTPSNSLSAHQTGINTDIDRSQNPSTQSGPSKLSQALQELSRQSSQMGLSRQSLTQPGLSTQSLIREGLSRVSFPHQASNRPSLPPQAPVQTSPFVGLQGPGRAFQAQLGRSTESTLQHSRVGLVGDHDPNSPSAGQSLSAAKDQNVKHAIAQSQHPPDQPFIDHVFDNLDFVPPPVFTGRRSNQ